MFTSSRDFPILLIVLIRDLHIGWKIAARLTPFWLTHTTRATFLLGSGSFLNTGAVALHGSSSSQPRNHCKFVNGLSIRGLEQRKYATLFRRVAWPTTLLALSKAVTCARTCHPWSLLLFTPIGVYSREYSTVNSKYWKLGSCLNRCIFSLSEYSFRIFWPAGTDRHHTARFLECFEDFSWRLYISKIARNIRE